MPKYKHGLSKSNDGTEELMTNPLDLVKGHSGGDMMIAEFPQQVGAIRFSGAGSLQPGYQGGLFKAKYHRRWRGANGKWRYEYEKPSARHRGVKPTEERKGTITRDEIDMAGRSASTPTDAVAQWRSESEYSTASGISWADWSAHTSDLNGRIAGSLGRRNGWTPAQVKRAHSALDRAPHSYARGSRAWPVDVGAIASVAAGRQA